MMLLQFRHFDEDFNENSSIRIIVDDSYGEIFWQKSYRVEVKITAHYFCSSSKNSAILDKSTTFGSQLEFRT